MKRYNSSFYLFWFELINIIYMLPLVFFFFKLFSFFLQAFYLQCHYSLRLHVLASFILLLCLFISKCPFVFKMPYFYVRLKCCIRVYVFVCVLIYNIYIILLHNTSRCLLLKIKCFMYPVFLLYQISILFI